MVRTDRLGETLLTLPAALAFRSMAPQAHLTLMMQTELCRLLEGVPGIDAVLSYQEEPGRPWWRAAAALGRRWRAERFDVAVIANPTKAFHVAAFLAGIPTRVGYSRKWGWMLTHRVEDAKALGDRHEVEYNFDLVRALGLPTPTPQWPWSSFASEQTEIARLLARQGLEGSAPFVAIHPWTSNPVKQWPVERFRALIRTLAKRLPVVLIGGPEERARIREVAPQDAAAPRVVDAVGQTSLRQLAALLQRARALVSNDSGPVHLAAALGTRTVVLFGAEEPATGPRRWGPWGPGHVVICRPSLAAITLEDVISAVDRQTEAAPIGGAHA